MERFTYVRPNSIPEAVALLNEPGLRSLPLAGGTDLLLLLRHNQKTCDRVVDISLLPELHRIERRQGWVSIGAAATFSEVMESDIVHETAPLLTQACAQIGAVQIRNMGTLGGNVVNAAACADTLPPLVCLEAVARAVAPHQTLEWPLSEFILAPNHTRLPAGALLVSLDYPIPPAGTRSLFLKLGRRNAMAISRLTVAAMGRLEGNKIAEVRLVPGSVTPQTVRLRPVEVFLLGQAPSPELLRQAAQLAVEEVRRLVGRRWSSEYKEPALAVLVYRALHTLFLPPCPAEAH